MLLTTHHKFLGCFWSNFQAEHSWPNSYNERKVVLYLSLIISGEIWRTEKMKAQLPLPKMDRRMTKQIPSPHHNPPQGEKCVNMKSNCMRCNFATKNLPSSYWLAWECPSPWIFTYENMSVTKPIDTPPPRPPLIAPRVSGIHGTIIQQRGSGWVLSKYSLYGTVLTVRGGVGWV